MKKCSRCKQLLPYSDFGKNKWQKDDLQHYCKKCKAKADKKYKDKNRNKIKNKQHEYDLKTNYKSQKKYQKTEKGKKIHRTTNKKYRKTEKGKKTAKKIAKKYKKNHPQKIKEWKRKNKAKRKRELGYFELWSNPFPDEIKIDYHHINNLIVIPMPINLHQNTSTHDRKKHREECKKIIEKLYCIDLEILYGKK